MPKAPKTPQVQYGNVNVGRIKEEIKTFLDSNPSAEVDVEEKDGIINFRICRPWNDSSLAIHLPKERDILVGVLNQVVMPPRFRGIWHKDTSDLEIAWTPFRLPKSQSDIYGRRFEFTFRKKTYNCEFGDSSNRLVEIAKNIRPLTTSMSNFRNLREFNSYCQIPEENRSRFGYDIPKSFWIRKIKNKEDDLVSIVSNLNFYLTYYDYNCPHVMIEDVSEEGKIEALKRERFKHGAFPGKIDARGLDEILLSFWVSADSGHPMLRFLLYYRIIEYATTHFADTKVRSELRKAVLAPDFREDLGKTVAKIVGIFSDVKSEDPNRFISMIKEYVDAELLWGEIKKNSGVFSRETYFDGGFKVAPILSANDTLEVFRQRGVDQFCQAIRKIRNALSHGKDQATSGVITPSSSNLRKLLPWVHIIGVAAGEVILYRDGG